MDVTLRARLRAVLGPAVPVDWDESAPAAPMPRVVLTRVSGSASYTYDAQATLCEARVQIDCIAATAAGKRQLAQAVRDALSAWRGGEIVAVFVVGERALPMVGAASGEAVKVQSVDVMVHYQEAE